MFFEPDPLDFDGAVDSVYTVDLRHHVWRMSALPPSRSSNQGLDVTSHTALQNGDQEIGKMKFF